MTIPVPSRKWTRKWTQGSGWSILAAVAMTSLVGVAPVTAYPLYRRYFKHVYSQPVRCELCHGMGGGTERTLYGKAWAKAGESVDAFKTIEGEDSDRDGISNGEELKKGSNPGDKKSVPGNPGIIWSRTQTIPIPTEQLSLVLGHVATIEAMEANLTDKQISAIESGIGRRLRFDERFPTLFFGVKEVGNHKRRESIALFGHFEVSGERFSLLTALDLEGKIMTIAMFRAGKHEGSVYFPYLKCLKGRTKSDLPLPGKSGCPSMSHYPATKAIHDAIEMITWTVTALFSKP